jgi:hypothetical protein
MKTKIPFKAGLNVSGSLSQLLVATMLLKQGQVNG